MDAHLNSRDKEDLEMPPLMILCGGMGTRLRDVTELLPKPMVPIGEHPIIWHLMRSYAAFGVRRFILCLGYKRDCFVDYFLNFQAYFSDVTVHLGQSRPITYHDSGIESEWQVTLANTGIDTMTGGRVAIASKHLKESDQTFFLTYGDALSDIDIHELLKFHRMSKKLLTVTAVHPEGRFGEIRLKNGKVEAFEEKPLQIEEFINGGFMVVERKFVLRHLTNEKSLRFETTPMRNALADNQLAAFPHNGFWQCMDTPREYAFLNALWENGDAPWTKHW